ATGVDPQLDAANDPAELQIVEWLVRLKKLDVPRPVGGCHVVVVELPTLLADERSGSDPFPSAGEIVGEGGKPELLVLLPIDVGGKLGEAAKAPFAFPQLLLRPYAVCHIGCHTAVPAERSPDVENGLARDGHETRLAIADTPQQQIAERPARLEHCLMLIPGRVNDLGGG